MVPAADTKGVSDPIAFGSSRVCDPPVLYFASSHFSFIPPLVALRRDSSAVPKKENKKNSIYNNVFLFSGATS